MYVFYDPNDKVVPDRILGSCAATSPTDQPGSMGGLPSLYLDDSQYAYVASNLGGYKVIANAVVALTTAETNAIQAAYVAPPPTTDDKVAELAKENNTLRMSHNAVNDSLNNLIDYLGQKGVL